MAPYGKDSDEQNPKSNNGSTRNPEGPRKQGKQTRPPTRPQEYDMEPSRQVPGKQKMPEFDQEPRQPQRQRPPAKQSTGDGGVTVVSARTPSTGKLIKKSLKS